MKKYILLLSLVVIVIGWTACSETSNGPGCRIKGYLSFKEYKKVYLTDNSENRIDSCEVKDGRFYLEEKGNISEPYVAIIHMTAEQDSTDQLDPDLWRGGSIHDDSDAGSRHDSGVHSFCNCCRQSAARFLRPLSY